MLLPGNELIQALCRTLFYSLWQGLAVAVLAAIAIVCTKRFKPVIRYSIFTGLLFAFIITSTVTFFYALQVVGAKNSAAILSPQTFIVAINTNANTLQPAPVSAGPVSVASTVFAWFTAHANSIVLCWLLIIAFRCVQMFTGLKVVYTLKRKGTSPAGEYWNNRMQQLAASIHVKTSVTLMQSVLAKVPMVIGHFKPMILIPAGVLTALPQDEIEAILLHELAHIRRKDYLVNMLQNFCEILFFFNPAILWLSSLIKDERENCCDDIALNQVKNKKQFIHALISFQEYNMAASNYAVGFPGKKDHLLNRVKRIITNNNKTLTNMEKTFLATAIVLVSFVTIAFAQTQKNTPRKKAQALQQADKKAAADGSSAAGKAGAEDIGNDSAGFAAQAEDTIPAGDNAPKGHARSDISSTVDGKTYRLVEENGELAEFYVDGDKIPADKLSQYQDIIDKIHNQIKEFGKQRQLFSLQQRKFEQIHQQFKQQQEQFAKQQQEWLKQSDSTNKQQWNEQQEQFKEQQKIFLKQQEIYQQQQEELRKQMDSGRQYMYNSPVYITAPVAPVTVTTPHVTTSAAITTTAHAYVSEAPLVTIAAPAVAVAPVTTLTRTPITVTSPVTVTTPAIAVHPVVFVAPVAPVVPTDNKLINNILIDLKKENVIIPDNGIAFKLDDKELTVNGVKQPGALQAKLKAKYLKGPKDHVYYKATEHTSSTDITIDNED